MLSGNVKHAAILAVILSACGPAERPDQYPRVPPLPVVVVYAHNAEMRDEYLAGARAWEPLGFIVEEGRHGTRRECGRRWFESFDGESRPDCQITIPIVVDPLLVAKTGSDGMATADPRGIYIDASVIAPPLNPRYLARLAAHEFGHVLLDTHIHTPTGLMSGEDRDPVMGEADYQLACEEIGVCL